MNASSSVSVERAAVEIWGIAGKGTACMHQRNTIAAGGFVHEVRRDKHRDLVAARDLDDQFPEAVSRHRIDSACRFV